VFSVNTAHFISAEAPDRFDYHISTGAEAIVISASSPNVEVPPGSSAVLERLMRIASSGPFLFLTRDGEPIVGIVPADVARSILAWPGDLDDSPPDEEIPPVDNPATLRGPGVPDFDEWYAAVMMDRQP
jgi:hypothetical protein